MDKEERMLIKFKNKIIYIKKIITRTIRKIKQRTKTKNKNKKKNSRKKM